MNTATSTALSQAQVQKIDIAADIAIALFSLWEFRDYELTEQTVLGQIGDGVLLRCTTEPDLIVGAV